MKKLSAILMVLCMMLALTACSEKKNIITGYKSGDVTLGQYKGLNYVPMTVEVSDEDVERQLSNFCALYSKKVEITDRTDVRENDYANIDFVGTKDGVAFEGGSSEGFDLLVGSNQFIDGFEAGLVGKNVGETVILDLTFPENYGTAELAGAAVQFEVKINAISRLEIPELTDELVSSNTEYKTVDEYRARITENLKASNQSNADSDKDYQIIQQLISNCTYNVDLTAEIEKAKNNMIAEYDSMYQQSYGADAATVYYYTYGMDADSFNAYMLQAAETNTKYVFAISAIAEAEEITATDAEAAELANRMTSTYGYNSVDELYAHLKEAYGVDGKEVVAEQVKLNKAADIVAGTAVIAQTEVTE